MKLVKKTEQGEEDDVFDCTVDLPPLVLSGDDYEAAFLRSEVKKNWDGTQVAKVFLHFEVHFAGGGTGMQLYMACNGPRGKKWPVSSKYTRAWIIAAGKKPMRADRLSPKVFEGKIFKVRIRVVTHNSHKHPLLPDQQYSVIDEILECRGAIPVTMPPANPLAEQEEGRAAVGMGGGRSTGEGEVLV